MSPKQAFLVGVVIFVDFKSRHATYQREDCGAIKSSECCQIFLENSRTSDMLQLLWGS